MLGFCCNCGGREEEWQVPLTEVRLHDGQFDGALQMAFESLTYAAENWEARREVDVLDYGRMALDVSVLAEQRRQWREREDKRRASARRKARRLLRQSVSPEVWSEFRRKKEFHITGSDGRVYRISHQIGSNVTLVVNGLDVARYCLVPKGHEWIPEPDMMLAVKLMLETNARGFLRRANKTELRRTG